MKTSFIYTLIGNLQSAIRNPQSVICLAGWVGLFIALPCLAGPLEDRERALLRAEIARDTLLLSEDRAEAMNELVSDFQLGKTGLDAKGNLIRNESYISMSAPNRIDIISWQAKGKEVSYYKQWANMYNQDLPSRISELPPLPSQGDLQLLEQKYIRITPEGSQRYQLIYLKNGDRMTTTNGSELTELTIETYNSLMDWEIDNSMVSEGETIDYIDFFKEDIRGVISGQ
ncbi:MAG: hypothetical protein QME81_03775 [bacterium]|nr:hypothetical protein [bacterium]